MAYGIRGTLSEPCTIAVYDKTTHDLITTKVVTETGSYDIALNTTQGNYNVVAFPSNIEFNGAVLRNIESIIGVDGDIPSESFDIIKEAIFLNVSDYEEYLITLDGLPIAPIRSSSMGNFTLSETPVMPDTYEGYSYHELRLGPSDTAEIKSNTMLDFILTNTPLQSPIHPSMDDLSFVLGEISVQDGNINLGGMGTFTLTE